MRNWFSFGVALMALILGPAGIRAEGAIPELSKNRQVYFSPNGGSEQAAASAIDLAQTIILVRAYQIDSGLIARALIGVYERGIEVKVILGKGLLNAPGSQAGLLIRAGIPVWIDSVPDMPRNTVMVIDAKTVIAGTVTFTTPPGKSDSKDLLVMDDIMLAAQYAREWNQCRELSELYR